MNHHYKRLPAGEAECIRMILLLADIESWLKELQKNMITSIHAPAGKLLRGREFRVTVSGLAHVLERHYHSTLRHPGTGKFLISLPELLDLLKEAAVIEPKQLPGSNSYKRVLECDHFIGVNREGNSSCVMVVLTDEQGRMVTAFPG